jgi:hypothetical protein
MKRHLNRIINSLFYFNYRQQFLLIIVGLLTNTLALSQYNNFWNLQYGNLSTLLGGAVTASYTDNGSIYYNPATLAFRDSVRVSFSAALYSSNLMKITNSTSIDSTSRVYGFKRFPISLYPVFKLNATSSLGLIYLARIYSNFDFHEYVDARKDIDNDGSNEQFISSFDYKNDLSEDWYGVSYSKLLSSKSSIGIATYVSYRRHNYINNYTADVVFDVAKRDYLTTDIQHYMTYYQYSGIFKIGYFHEFDNFSFGCALTLPSFSIFSSALSTSRLYLTGYQDYFPADTINSLLIQTEASNAKANHKYPSSLNIGIKKKFDNVSIYSSAEVYLPIQKYRLFDFNNELNGIPPVYPSVTDLILNSETESRLLLNLAFGMQILAKNGRITSLGLCTDFNSLPKSFKPRGYNTSFGRNNIYHLTVGRELTVLKIRVNGGLKFSYGYSNNLTQFVDMNSASPSNFLLGDRKPISDYRIMALSLLLGFNF